MTVEELIERLSKLPKNKKVVRWHNEEPDWVVEGYYETFEIQKVITEDGEEAIEIL